MRNIIKIFTILLSLLLFSCQEDNIEKVETNSNESRKLNIWRFPVEQVLKHKPNIKKQLDNLKTLKTQAKLTSSTYDFSIEETDAQVIFDDNYTQYTFKVQRENPNDNVLENYICKVFNNGEVQQFLISYPYIENENGIVYDTQNITMQPITDNSLIINSLNARIGCVPEFVSVLKTYECENVPCSGDGHQAGEDCNCGVTANCTVAHTECNWVTTVVWGYNCPNGGIDGSTNDGSDLPQGGNSSTGNTTNPDDEIVTVPFDDSRSKAKECKKIKDGLDNNPVFKTKIQNLSIPANLNLNYEKAAGTFEGSNAITEWQGSPSVPEAYINYNPSDELTALFHTHPDIGSGTLACFSDEDLAGIAVLIRFGDIAADKFVAYLATKKGTYLALTITNPTKFLNLFYSKTFPENGVGITTNDWPKVIASDKALEEPLYKYYDPKNKNRLIKETDTDTENVLKQFLNFLKEADAGVALFETDATFSSFTRLELTNPTTINRSNLCN
jgi:hypothetical protein